LVGKLPLSANFAPSIAFPSSSTKESLSCLFPTSRPSVVMLVFSKSIHSILRVGSFVSSLLSNFLVSSLTGSLGGNSNYVSLRTSMSLGMVVDSKGQNPYIIS
jgi:hypothetical protein